MRDTPRLASALTVFCFAGIPFLPGSLSAQKTWIVDKNGGGNFTTLQAAFDGASSGDTLRVRPGVYSHGTTSKAFVMLGGPNTSLGRIYVQNMAAGQRFVMKNFQLSSSITFRNVKGSVHLESVTSVRFPIFVPVSGLTIDSTAQVSVNRCTFSGLYPPIHVKNSTAYFTSVTAVGNTAFRNGWGKFVAKPGLICELSHVVVAGGSYAGGSGSYTFNKGPMASAPGMKLVSGSLFVAGDGSTTIRAGAAGSIYNTVRTPAIQATAGTLQVAPTLKLSSTNGASTIQGAAKVATVARSTLAGSSGAPGTSLTIDTFGAVGSTSLLFVSLPGPRIAFSLGDLWLDTLLMFPLASDKIDGTGHVVRKFALDKNFPLGLPLTFQALNTSNRVPWVTTPLTLVLY